MEITNGTNAYIYLSIIINIDLTHIDLKAMQIDSLASLVYLKQIILISFANKTLTMIVMNKSQRISISNF